MGKSPCIDICHTAIIDIAIIESSNMIRQNTSHRKTRTKELGGYTRPLFWERKLKCLAIYKFIAPGSKNTLITFIHSRKMRTQSQMKLLCRPSKEMSFNVVIFGSDKQTFVKFIETENVDRSTCLSKCHVPARVTFFFFSKIKISLPSKQAKLRFHFHLSDFMADERKHLLARCGRALLFELAAQNITCYLDFASG